MRTVRPVKTTIAAVTAASLLALSACGSDGDSEENDDAPVAQSEASETPGEEPSETPGDEETDEPAAGDQPAWAEPVTTPGEQLTSFEVGDLSIDVYQVGTTPAPENGSWVDPETNEPLIAEGDPVVFVNYVVTNNGDPIDLSASLVTIDAQYEDWQWMQGMGGMSDSDLYEQMEVNDGAISAEGYQESGIYTFGAGEQISFGDNFHHQEDSPITFTATVVPVDSEGELLHDDREEAEASATIE